MFPFNVQFNKSYDPYKFRTQDELFSQPPQEEETSPLVQPPKPSLMDIYQQLSSRPTPNRDAYSEFVKQGTPDYTPNKMTRLAAILSGGAAGFRNPAQGVQVANDVLQEPYRRQMQDYVSKRQALKDLAEIEADTQGKGLQDLNTISTIQNREDDNTRAAKTAEATIRNLDDQMRTRVITRAEGEARLKTIGFQRVSRPDGTEEYVNPTTGQSYPLGKTHEGVTEKATREAGEFNRQRGVIFGQQKSLQSSAQEFSKTQQEDRQKEAADNIRLRNNLAAEREARKIGKTDEMSVGKLRKNLETVQATVKSDPNRYSKYWVIQDDGSGTMGLSKQPDYTKDLPAYQDWVELYNTLYAGTGKSLTKYPEVR